jgi:hypothetical protein
MGKVGGLNFASLNYRTKRERRQAKSEAAAYFPAEQRFWLEIGSVIGVARAKLFPKQRVEKSREGPRQWAT